MARVRSIEQIASNVRSHPTEVDCGWQLLDSPDGRLLQLSTYGSDARKSQPKVSQTLQFDRVAAAELIRALRSTFPGL